MVAVRITAELASWHGWRRATRNTICSASGHAHEPTRGIVAWYSFVANAAGGPNGLAEIMPSWRATKRAYGLASRHRHVACRESFQNPVQSVASLRTAAEASRDESRVAQRRPLLAERLHRRGRLRRRRPGRRTDSAIGRRPLVLPSARPTTQRDERLKDVLDRPRLATRRMGVSANSGAPSPPTAEPRRTRPKSRGVSSRSLSVTLPRAFPGILARSARRAPGRARRWRRA